MYSRLFIRLKILQEHYIDEYRQNAQPTQFDQGVSSISRRRGWDNPAPDQRQPRGYNKNMSHFPQEQMDSNPRTSGAAPESRPKVIVDGSISLNNPNFDHQAGNFFSPTQDNYFSNTNLSLINDTAQRRGEQHDHSRNSPSFYELGGTQAQHTNTFNNTSLNYSQKNSTKKQLYTVPSPNEKSNIQNPRFSSLKGNEFMEQIENEDRNSTQRDSHHEERNNATSDEPKDSQIPFLTRAEKEVLKMKVLFVCF